MATDDALLQARDDLERSGRVDTSRLELALEDGTIVLQGAVSTPEEASVAEMVVSRYADEVVNRLRVDAGLREGTEEPQDTERAIPADNEVLVGSPDMLAGPDPGVRTEVADALEENEPWNPPDEPQLADPIADHAEARSEGDEQPDGDPDPDEAGPADKAAADLSQADLEAAAEGAPAPSLDPEAVAAPDGAQPDPLGVDTLGESPGYESPAFTEHEHTAEATGAVGEGTAGGGSTGGVPATETGATGVDTEEADPVTRGTGGTASDSGTDRGPPAPEDAPLREDFPSGG